MAVPAPIDDDVLDAVARVLERAGVRGLSLSAVADEAGVSRVTLHRRGVGVDDFAVAVLERASNDLRRALWPAITDTGDAASRLRAGLRTLCEVAERHAAALTAFYAEPARPIPDRPGRTTSFEFIEPFERLLLDGQLDRSLLVDDPADQATITANSACWTYLHMRRAHNWPVRKATDHVISLTMAHLLPDAQPRAAAPARTIRGDVDPEPRGGPADDGPGLQ